MATSPAIANASTIRALQAPTGPKYTPFAATVYRLPGGASPAWAATALPDLNPPSTVGTPVSRAFVNDTPGWGVTQGVASGGLVYTVDGGTTGLVSEPQAPRDGTAAKQVNALWMHSGGALGVIVGSNGMILRTTTGGQ